MSDIEIQDDSNDKKYFTIIPNFILNHSTAVDQALYLQMKRLAGENGKCFATEKTLRSKLGVGEIAFKKALNYLLEHKWIEFVGMTQGRTRPINTYRVNDLWEMNNQFYSKKGKEKFQEKKVNIIQTPSRKSGIAEVSKETPREEAEKFFSDQDFRLKKTVEWFGEKIPENVLRMELNKFVIHWGELNGSGKKQAWELKPTFEVKRRLVTWFLNAMKYNQGFQKKGRQIL
jgi:hypothetical protein